MENNISKLYAVILDRTMNGNGPGGNCKVHCVEISNGKNYDPDFIKRELPSDGLVFSSQLFSDVNANALIVSDLIEIPLKEISYQTDATKNIYIKHGVVKKVGTKLIYISDDIVNQDFLDIEKIYQFLISENFEIDKLGKFYLSDSIYLFGPFKVEKNTLTPAFGKSVFKYDFNMDKIIEADGLKFDYILEDPKNKISEVDCMSKIQVLEHLKKTLLGFQNINIEINKIKEIKELIIKNNEGSDGIEKIRLSRSEKYLSELVLTYDELTRLKNLKQEWSEIFTNSYQIHKETFAQEIFKDLESTKKEKEQELADLRKSIDDSLSILEDKKNDLKEINKELKNIHEKKEDLILSIKIAAGINNHSKSIIKSEKRKYYEVMQNLNMDLPFFDDCEDYLDHLKDKKWIKAEQKKYFRDGIHWLSKSNFIIANSTAFVINLIQTLGTYKLILQNAEIDWIKFDYIFKNGLKEIVQSAAENSQIPHFYVLQDFNIASFECYGKPLIDVANKTRKKVPGSDVDWPKNLFFIGVKIESEIQDFGFELNEKTFRNWSRLPYLENFKRIKSIVVEGRVDLKKIQIDEQINNYWEEYFVQ